MTDPSEVLNTPWDFSGITIPSVTISGALAISN